MSIETVYFIAPLANVDSSILKLHLGHGFKIEGMPDHAGALLISMLEGVPFQVAYEKLYILLRCLNSDEKKVYVITNTLKSDVKRDDKGKVKEFSPEVMKFNNNRFDGYLDPLIRLMRLFKKGNITVPSRYYYLIHKGIPQSFVGMGSFLWISAEPYALENSEIPALLRFIRKTKLPFGKPFLQLAFENFELSYEIHNINLSFLSLMMGLETLLNPGRHEVRYRLSRNTAVLLGKEESDSKNLFLEVRKLYDKRCDIVHEGKSNIVSGQELLRLRHLVRESIKEVSETGKTKKELMDLLNSCGFGERAWRK